MADRVIVQTRAIELSHEVVGGIELPTSDSSSVWWTIYPDIVRVRMADGREVYARLYEWRVAAFREQRR